MAATDFFLKIDGIDGEAQDKGLEKHIQVESWSIGATNSGSSMMGGGSASGKVNFQDFHFTMQMSSASTKLLLHCATGIHIPTAKLTCRKATGDGGQQKYLEVTMNDLLVSSYQSAAHGSVTPAESISLNFSKIKMEYFEQDAKGILSSKGITGWDVKKNAKV